MKIIGLLRIRNESEIIRNTLDYMATFCDFAIVYDDCSTDDTVEICKSHPLVRHTIEGMHWSRNRKRAEFRNRQVLLDTGRQYAEKDDWFVYQDADEYIEFDFNKLYESDSIAVKMKLFDFYITPDDIEAHYMDRKWLGPEYREIIMAFKNHPNLSYDSPDQREVHLNHKGNILEDGYVRHYGKAISIEEWNRTCEYYGNHFPKYSEKWKKRMGKAVHETSSFGLPLIQWEEKNKYGVLLTKEIQMNSIY